MPCICILPSRDESVTLKVCPICSYLIHLKLPPHPTAICFSTFPKSPWAVDSLGAPPRLPLPAGASPQVFWVLSGEWPLADESQLLGKWKRHHSPHLPEWRTTARFRDTKAWPHSTAAARWDPSVVWFVLQSPVRQSRPCFAQGRMLPWLFPLHCPAYPTSFLVYPKDLSLQSHVSEALS